MCYLIYEKIRFTLFNKFIYPAAAIIIPFNYIMLREKKCRLHENGKHRIKLKIHTTFINKTN